jgi:phosphate transport system ATP-binding protein
MAPSSFSDPHPKMPPPVSHDWLSGLPSEDRSAVDSPNPSKSILFCRGLSIFYGDSQVVFDVDLDIRRNEVMALIGPSGSGKTSILRCLNRMNDHHPLCRVSGSVWFEGKDIYGIHSDAVVTRMAIGMVFQKPNPYPRSIYENIAYGLRIHGKVSCVTEENVLVERCLRQAGLWPELGQRLKQSALELSLGQQQRLCIARALAINPEVILMDEPCSSLDPISTASVESLIKELGSRAAIVVVTQSLQQAARISARTAFLHRGRLVEMGPTTRLFTSPRHDLTARYLSGQVGRPFEDLNHE